jgi:hypothetical protein
MPFPDVSPDPFLHLLEIVTLWSPLGEQCLMDFLGAVPTGSPYNDLFSLFIPFQHGSRANPEFATHFSGYRYLPLGRDLRPSLCLGLSFYLGIE